MSTSSIEIKTIFTDIKLSLPIGSWTAILGASGIGKSTFLKSIKLEAACMWQADLLLPWLTVIENVLLPLSLHGKANIEQAMRLLQKLKLAHAAELYPHQLSGGMKQRIALARTLIQDKSLILMDEPFSALDTITRHDLQNLAQELLTNKTVLFVTHDPAEALRLADHIYIMHGNPATLSLAANLISASPRDTHQTEIITIHKNLLSQLAEVA